MVTTTKGEVKVISICGIDAEVAAWQQALERARKQGVKVYHDGQNWYTSSVSEPDKTHQVNGQCDCKGAERGLLCKHYAAVVAARYRLGELRQCAACGRVLPVSQMVTEWQHVGGRADRLDWFCGPGYGHQA